MREMCALRSCHGPMWPVVIHSSRFSNSRPYFELFANSALADVALPDNYKLIAKPAERRPWGTVSTGPL